MQIFQTAAKRGSLLSNFNIGKLYADNSDVFIAAKDSFRCSDDEDCARKAVTWYAEAAKQGNAVAQNNLGYMYDSKRGVRGRIEGVDLNCTEDDEDCYRKAVTWYAKAAKQGDAVAQYNLGSMYGSKRGVRGRTEGEDLNCTDDEDCDRQAVTWYAKAAKQGDAVAQYSLGNMYDSKHGVRGRTEGEDLNCTDDEDCDRKAVTWYAKAAKQESEYALENLAYMYRSLRGVTTIDDPTLLCNDKASCEAKAKALDEQRKALSP
ncbi:MAG: sel1 repeat family protein [Rhodobacter sp.]|nr:sel1 repeat family protein [Rhodobacter sp.]